MVHTVNARMGIADLNAMMGAALRGSEAEKQCNFKLELFWFFVKCEVFFFLIEALLQ